MLITNKALKTPISLSGRFSSSTALMNSTAHAALKMPVVVTHIAMRAHEAVGIICKNIPSGFLIWNKGASFHDAAFMQTGQPTGAALTVVHLYVNRDGMQVGPSENSIRKGTSDRPVLGWAE